MKAFLNASTYLWCDDAAELESVVGVSAVTMVTRGRALPDGEKRLGRQV